MEALENLWKEPFSAAAFFALLMGVIAAIFCHRARDAWWSLAAALVLGTLAGRVAWLGWLSTAAIVTIGLVYYRLPLRSPRALCGLVFFAVCFLVSQRIIPAFKNWEILSGIVFGEHSPPHSIWWNIDKPLIAIVIGGLCLVYREPSANRANLLTTVGTSLVGFLLTIGLAILFGFVAWDPKFPHLFGIWALTNLFFTCCGEEALFRGFLQKELNHFFPGPRFRWVPVLIAAVIFGLAHFGGGLAYVELAIVAGFFYGWIYYQTGSLRASIILHFLFNTAHFIFFTYPSLSR